MDLGIHIDVDPLGLRATYLTCFLGQKYKFAYVVIEFHTTICVETFLQLSNARHFVNGYTYSLSLTISPLGRGYRGSISPRLCRAIQDRYDGVGSDNTPRNQHERFDACGLSGRVTYPHRLLGGKYDLVAALVGSTGKPIVGLASVYAKVFVHD